METAKAIYLPGGGGSQGLKLVTNEDIAAALQDQRLNESGSFVWERVE
jgi:hypothetical protein